MAVSQTLTLTQISQDQENNQSQVRILWRSTQTGESYNLNPRQAHYTVTAGGVSRTYTVSYALHLRSTDTIVDTTVTVPHDDSGNGSITVTTWMDTKISAGVVQLTSTKTMTTISRESRASVTSVPVGEPFVVTVDRKNSSYTHTLYCDLGGKYRFYLGADGSRKSDAVQLTAETISCPTGKAEYEAFTADSRTIPCSVRCTTYRDGTQIGQPKTTAFVLSTKEVDCGPSITEAAVKDVNPVTLALTGDEHTLIRGYSEARCTAEVQTKYGAKVTAFTVNGEALNPESGVRSFIGVQTGQFLFSVTDSRRYTAGQTVNCPLIPYIPITCTASAKRLSPAGDAVRLTVTGAFFGGSFGTQDNSITIHLRINGGEPTAVTPITEEDGYRLETEIDLDYEKKHTLEITVQDALQTVVKTLTVMQGIPVFDWGREDFVFHVPIQAPNIFTWNGLYREDMDQLTTQGSYLIWQNTPNFPIQDGIALVFGSAGTYTLQMAFSWNGDVRKLRVKWWDLDWGEWRDL